MIDQLTSEQHWQYFAEFCRLERAGGGPDPHMQLVGEMSKDQPLAERVWRGGCYVGVYNVPGAEAIWRQFPWGAPLTDADAWLRSHWDGITTRRERRCVRDAGKLARYLRSYAEWAQQSWPAHQHASEDGYAAGWESAQSVYTLGRYATIKLLEYLHRYCEWRPVMPDIRADGGDSPREALALLHPAQAELLRGGRGPDAIAQIEAIATATKAHLAARYDVHLSYFLLQVLLCDYKQAIVGQRQYPGRSHDSELHYAAVVEKHFGQRSDMWRAREALFPRRVLGECGGWSDVRKELGGTLAQHGYAWTDLQYDYVNTTMLGEPKAWA